MVGQTSAHRRDPMKIDEKSTIPIGWFALGMSLVISITSAGTLFVYSVNFRLSRIEQKLGIVSAEISVIEDAKAKD